MSTHLSDPLAAADPVAAVVAAHASGDALVLHTSGTSASARPVVRTTASWWTSFRAYSQLTGVGPGARVWVPGPLRGTMNLFAAVHARVVGATVVGEPGEATHACLTPAALVRGGDALRSGTHVVVAGDTLTPALHEHATGRGLHVVHYYGAAELSFVAAGAHAGDLRVFPGVEAAVVDGEIRVRSPYLAEAGSGALRFEGGWATVGDRGRLDGDHLVVLGRPDAVTTGGATVLVAEVEASLAAVARAPVAVVGLPHPDLGAVLTAVLTDDRDRAPLQDHARTHLDAAQRPRRWHVVDALPLTPGGKVDRGRLAAALAPRSSR